MNNPRDTLGGLAQVTSRWAAQGLKPVRRGSSQPTSLTVSEAKFSTFMASDTMLPPSRFLSPLLPEHPFSQPPASPTPWQTTKPQAWLSRNCLPLFPCPPRATFNGTQPCIFLLTNYWAPQLTIMSARNCQNIRGLARKNAAINASSFHVTRLDTF